MRCLIHLNISLLVLLTAFWGCKESTEPENQLTSNWQIYNTGNSELPNNRITALTLIGSNEIWIGTYNGLAIFDGTEWQVFTSNDSDLPPGTVSSIKSDKRGVKWIGVAGGGLARYDGSSWIVYNASNSEMTSNGIISLAIDVSGNIWIMTYHDGLFKFDLTSRVFYHPSNPVLINCDFTDLVIDKAFGYVYFGTLQGKLARLDLFNNWTIFDNSNSPLEDNSFIQSLFIDRIGNLWIGTVDSGIFKFDGMNWTFYDLYNHGLPEFLIFDIIVDNDGNIWIGTMGDGLIKISGETWTIYNTSNSELPSDHISTLLMNELKEELWVGTEGAGLAKLKLVDQ